ncbi:MAG TPA: hypothetical protein VFA93_03185 [Patescibacteria group bacterium]|nr:hypothetical protein [Patescibacteria group bacterium]
MKELFSNLKSDRIIYQIAQIILAVNLLGVLIIILFFGKLPPFTPLFNQMPWGEQRIAPTIFIFLPSVLSLIIFAANIFFASYLYRKNPLIARLFSITSFLVSVLVLIFIIRTIHTVI